MVGMLRQAQNERKILNPFKCFRLSESSKDDYQEPLVQDIRGAGTADLEAIEKGGRAGLSTSSVAPLV